MENRTIGIVLLLYGNATFLLSFPLNYPMLAGGSFGPYEQNTAIMTVSGIIFMLVGLLVLWMSRNDSGARRK